MLAVPAVTRGPRAMDYLLPAHCRVDIYEVDSRDKYTECAKTRSFYGLMFGGAIWIISIIILIYAFNTNTFIFALICTILTLISLFHWGFWAEWRAGAEYDSLMYELNSIQKDNPNYTVGEAKNIIRKERLAREQAQSRRDAAQITADAMRRPDEVNNLGDFFRSFKVTNR